MVYKKLWMLVVLALTLSLLGPSLAKNLSLPSTEKREDNKTKQKYSSPKVNHLLDIARQFLGTKDAPVLICNPSKLQWPQNLHRHHMNVAFDVAQISKVGMSGKNIVVCLDHFKEAQKVWLLKQWNPMRHLTNMILVGPREIQRESSLLSTFISLSARVFFFDDKIGFESYFVNGQHVKRDLVEISIIGEGVRLKWLENRSFLERRSNFQGMELHVAFINSPLYVTGPGDALDLAGPIFTTLSGDQMVTLDLANLEGISIDVLNELSNRMNFSSHVFTRMDQIWGHREQNGSWKGLVGTLEKNEADMVAALLSITAERLEALDYLPSLASDSYALFIKKHAQEEMSLLVFFRPFAYELWVGILSVVFLLGLSITVVEHLLMQNVIKTHIGHLSMELTKNLWRVFSSLLGGRTISTWKVTEHNGGHGYRALLLVSSLFGVAILASFRSSITSELSVLEEQMPFNSPEGLLQSNYKMTTSKAYSFAFEHIKSYGTASNLVDRILEKYGTFMKANPIEPTELDMKFLPNEHLAYFYSKENVERQESTACKLQLVWKVSNPLLLAPAVPKWSEYYELLTFNLEYLINNGFVNTARKRWEGKRRECGEKSAVPISKEKLAMPIALMILVLTVAPAILLCERLVARRTCKAVYVETGKKMPNEDSSPQNDQEEGTRNEQFEVWSEQNGTF